MHHRLDISGETVREGGDVHTELRREVYGLEPRRAEASGNVARRAINLSCLKRG